jgi:hypothetical protein
MLRIAHRRRRSLLGAGDGNAKKVKRDDDGIAAHE